MSWEDLEEDAKASIRSHGPQCSVAVMFEVIGEENGSEAVASVLNALHNHRLTTASIHRALQTRVESDYLPSVYSLGRHRKHQCSCPKEER